MMNPGNWGELGSQGGRVLRAGGHHLCGFGIAGAVLGAILWAALLIALILAIMTLIRNWRRPQALPMATGPDGGVVAAGPAGASPEAQRILEERYAKGEINHDEYLERKKDLTGS
jgi:putative membrane protein